VAAAICEVLVPEDRRTNKCGVRGKREIDDCGEIMTIFYFP
jgi:hypothetical protein